MTARLLPLALLLLATAAAQTVRPTETGVVAGVVTGVFPYDGETFEDEPLASVVVDLVGTPFVAVTGEGGLFMIPDVPPGRYRLRAQFLHERWSQTVVVRAGETVTALPEVELPVLCDVFIVHGFEVMSRGIYAPRVASYHAQRGPHAPWGRVPCMAWEAPDPSPLLHPRTR